MEQGLVEESDGPAPAAKGDERRRYYRLTRSGREALREEIERLDAVLRAARTNRIIPRGSRG
jgi:DNA-binding PadR family transcriptional regulator